MSLENNADGENSHGNTTKRISSKTLTNCVYTGCYCEENVWKLCEQIKQAQDDKDLTEYYVVFISNPDRKVPLWLQKQSKDPLTPVVWDYHVILAQKEGDRSQVYDLDTMLPFPCPFKMYTMQALQSEHTLKKEYHRKFRVIAAEEYLRTFASDRSHMLKPNGEYIQPPPDYPVIRTTEETMNLDEYIDMTPNFGEGKVMNLKGLTKFFSVPFI